MHRTNWMLILFLHILLSSPSIRAQTPTCDRLSANQKTLAQKLLSTQHPYDCCDDTILNCLKKKPTCSLTFRLAENICRRIAEKQDAATIKRALSRRAKSMLPTNRKASIDLTGATVAGDPNSPVTLVEYACARCPFCAKITPQIYDAVTKGSLKGKVKLYFKVFPIRGHEFSKETGLGFVAAEKLNRFWEFLLYSYRYFDSFCIAKQVSWADEAGMDRAAFERLVADPVTRQLLVESKKEGIVNKVDATPTFFINGRKYFGENSFEEIFDVLEEEYQSIKGLKYKK